MENDDNWLPLESNPQVMVDFAKKLGFNADKYTVQDLMSTEEWAQEMIPKPVLGVILLYEISASQKNFTKLQVTSLKEENNSKNIFYMKQLARNACGTIALFHVILNEADEYPDLICPDSQLQKFKAQSKGKSPQDIGDLFKKSKKVKDHHTSAVQQGQSQVQEEVQKHFIAFIHRDGALYQLDGGKDMPVFHGHCSKDQLLQKSCVQIQKFMQRDPNNLNFSTVVVCKAQEQ